MSADGVAASKKGTEIVAGLATLVRTMVDHPEEVSIVSCTALNVTVLSLSVAPDDVGKVIGKQGRTARSLRTILSAASMTAHHRYALDIVENGKTTAQELHP